MSKEGNPILGPRMTQDVQSSDTAFPSKELETIACSLEGSSSDEVALKQAAMRVVSYCNNMPSDQKMKHHFLSSIPRPEDKAVAAAHVRECAQAHVIPGWLLPVLAQVLQAIIENLLKGSTPVPAPAVKPKP